MHDTPGIPPVPFDPAISPMNTTGPTTWPAHSAFKLREALLDTDTPRRRFLVDRGQAQKKTAGRFVEIVTML